MDVHKIDIGKTGRLDISIKQTMLEKEKDGYDEYMKFYQSLSIFVGLPFESLHREIVLRFQPDNEKLLLEKIEEEKQIHDHYLRTTFPQLFRNPDRFKSSSE